MPRYWSPKREIDLLKVRQEITVEVLKAEQYDLGFPTGTLKEVIRDLQSVLEEIPEEYRNTAQVDFESVSSNYDSHYCEMTIFYRRPETDEEWETRKANVKKRQVQYEQKVLREAAAIKKGRK